MPDAPSQPGPPSALPNSDAAVQNMTQDEVWRDAHIVIVDDEPANLRLLDRILTQAGYRRITLIADPLEFVSGFHHHPPDLVLLDLMMPGMDGVEVLGEVRALTRPSECLPVLMITADTGHDAMSRALRAGVDDYLTKPFDPIEAQLRIANLLRTRRLSLEVATHNDLLEREVQRRTDELQLFRDVVAAVPDPILIEDPEEGIIYANDALTDGLDVNGRPDDHWTEAGLRQIAPKVAAGEQESMLIEESMPSSGGTHQPVEILVHAVHRGNRRLLVGIARDITTRLEARHALERALQRERHAVEELNRIADLKDNFLTAISHEIRTPLSVVNGAAQTLLRHGDALDPSVGQDLLRRLAANGQRLQDMLLDLLDLNKLVHGQIDLRLQRLRLDHLVHQRVDAVELGDRRIDLELQEIHIEADPERLARAIDALLTNVAKHTPGTTPASIVLKADDAVVLQVIDHGHGIPHQLKGRIFMPFEHGPTSAAHSPGTGIGLTLAKTLIEAHGGQLWVEDTPGGGATFTVQLPPTAADAGPAA